LRSRILGRDRKEGLTNVLLAALAIAGFILSFYFYSINLIAFIISMAIASFSALTLLMRIVIVAAAEVKVDPDFLFSILHMRALATGRAPAAEILDVVSRDSSYGRYGRVYRKIAVLVKEWGYSVPDAIIYVGRQVKEKVFREFLLRFATTSRLGEDLVPFLSVEYNTLKSEYENQYIRAVNSLRVLLGVYASTIGAVSFATAAFLLLAFFYGGRIEIVEASFVVALSALIAMALIILRVSPKDYFENEEESSPRARYIDFWSWASLLGVSLLLARDVILRKVYFTSFVAALGVLGVLLLPAGLMAVSYESYINDIDTFFPVFIRSLGSHLSIVPSLSKALRPLLRVELGKLKKPLRKLYALIEMGIPPSISWKKFAVITGSELVRRGTRIFSDVAERGGDLAEVGVFISDHTNFLIGLRRLKAQVAGGFISTVIVMHLTMVSLLELVLDLMIYFNGLLQSVRAGVPEELSTFIIIGGISEHTLRLLMTSFIFALTFLNSYVIAKSRPGSLKGFWFYLSILSMLSSATLLGTKYGVWWILKKIVGKQF
jgi:flagellar protein FlaJ